MRLYGGIDLHSNNSVVAVLDEQDKALYEKRLPNDLGVILGELGSYRKRLQGIVVESTFNWYWLVDALMEQGYRVHLANPAAMDQYKGLKYTNDAHDARWLAHLLRLGILPEGFIYPKEERAVRDLLRKRAQLVRQRTANVLSIENLVARNLGSVINVKAVNKLTEESIDTMMGEETLALAVKGNFSVVKCLDEQIGKIERAVLKRARLKPEYKVLLSVPGIGQTLALTVALETGPASRFPNVGDYASYCRCVGSTKLSNGKKKGRGNAKNGNKYLAWAYVEAATFAVRFNARIRRFHDRKKAKTNNALATKAVAHKLARACYWMMREHTTFDIDRAFA